MEQIHKKRLAKLADFLDVVPESSFNMGVYCEQGMEFPTPLTARWLRDKKDLCGTTACALGWAAMTPGMPKPKATEFWPDYGERMFGFVCDNFSVDGEKAGFEYEWMFDSCWEKTDFSGPRDAAARIRYFLDNGTPDTTPDSFGYVVPFHFRPELEKILLPYYGEEQ